MRGWTGLSPWKVNADWTPDFQLSLGDVDTDIRARDQCMVTCSRARDRPPRLGDRQPEGPRPARATQPESHPGPQLKGVKPGPQLEPGRPYRAVQEQVEGSTPRPQAPEALSEGLDTSNKRLSDIRSR